MMLFDKLILDKLCEILETNQAILQLLRHRLPHPHNTRSIDVKFTSPEGAFMAFNTLVLTVGQSSTASIVPLEADGVTVTPGAVASNQQYVISDPGISLTVNSDGTATVKGVSATASAVSGTASATVTDQDGTQNSFTQAFTVQVNAPTGRTTQIGVSFTTPA